MIALSACTAISYTPISKGKLSSGPFERKVEFSKADALYSFAPDCVVVWPVGLGMDKEKAALIEGSIARHLTDRVQRVIGPRERNKLARDDALDLQDNQDRKSFSQLQRCGYGVRVLAVKTSTQYLIVWSQNQVGLDLSLTRTETGEVLWRVRHIARRGHGGLPLSPVSFGMDMFDAGISNADKDQLPSVIDDTLRRMLLTLPDFRW